MQFFCIVTFSFLLFKACASEEVEIEIELTNATEAEVTVPPKSETKIKETYKDNAEQMEKLRKSLFSNYDKMTIPNNLTVQFGVALVNVDIDPAKRTLEAQMWNRYLWKDTRLAYDEKENGVSLLWSPVNEVWKPDMTLYNSRMTDRTKDEKCRETEVLIYPSGDVLWVPSCHISAMCNLKFNSGHLAPVQSCTLKFGSWVYNGDIMKIDFYNKKKKMDLEDFNKYSEWRIVKNEAELNTKYYPCCKEPYTSLIYNLTLSSELKNNDCKE